MTTALIIKVQIEIKLKGSKLQVLINTVQFSFILVFERLSKLFLNVKRF